MIRCASLRKKARDKSSQAEPSRNKISQKAHKTGRKRSKTPCFVEFFVFRQFLQVGNPSFVEFRDEISWLAHHNKEQNTGRCLCNMQPKRLKILYIKPT